MTHSRCKHRSFFSRFYSRLFRWAAWPVEEAFTERLDQMDTLVDQLKADNVKFASSFNTLKQTVLNKIAGIKNVGDPDQLKQQLTEMESEIQQIDDLNASISDTTAGGEGGDTTAGGGGTDTTAGSAGGQ